MKLINLYLLFVPALVLISCSSDKDINYYLDTNDYEDNNDQEFTRSYTDVRYGPTANTAPGYHIRQVLDLTLPSTGNGPFPLLIFIHGGAFIAGDKSDVRSTAFNNAPSRGYALASIRYRLAANGQAVGRFPDGIQDCLAAIRFLRANAAQYHLDTGRFAVSGFSAGAYHSAFITAFTNSEYADGITENLELGNAGFSSKVQAGVSWSALTDFLQKDAQQAMNPDINYMFQSNSPTSPEAIYIGGQITLPANAAILAKSNPLNYITVNTPPILMQHAKNDNLVPWQQSQIMVDKINEACGPGRAELELIPNGGHGGPPFNSASNVNKIFTYLDEKLAIRR
jgi:acetyl esterase/lipase